MTITLHGGKVSQYRGSSPMNWPIINGAMSGACAVLRFDSDPGVADVVYQIAPEETIVEVVARTLEIPPRLVGGVLDQIEAGTLVERAQFEGENCIWVSRVSGDGVIDLHLITAAEVVDPLAGWMEALLCPDQVRKDDIFDHRVVTRLWQERQKGTTNHYKKLWTLAVFQGWHRRITSA